MNNLSNLLSPTANNMLAHDLSMATLQKAKQSNLKETWIQKLKKGNTHQANPDKIDQIKKLSKGLHYGGELPPGSDLQGSMMSLIQMNSNQMSQMTLKT